MACICGNEMIRQYKHLSSAVRAGRRISKKLNTDTFVVVNVGKWLLLTEAGDEDELNVDEYYNGWRKGAYTYWTYNGVNSRGAEQI